MEDDEVTHTVELYIYDLTQGMASMISQMILDRQLEGIWHTAVVVFGKEYFYGGTGIQSAVPGSTILGQPGKIEKIGETFIPYPVFKDYVRGLAESTYRGSNYNLLDHNCNNFTEDLCQFLCGVSIPKYILDLPQDFLSSNVGQLVKPLLESLGAPQGNSFSFEPQITARERSPGFDDLNHEIEQARLESLALEERRQSIANKIAKKEKKKDKKHRKKGEGSSSSNQQNNLVNGYSSNSTTMSEVEVEQEVNGAVGQQQPPIPSEMLPSEQVLKDEAKELEEEEERKRNRIPPVVFPNIDPKEELEQLVTLIVGQLTREEEVSVEELHQYLLQNEGSWVLGDNFLSFVGRVLRDNNISTETRVHLIRVLAAAALKDDIVIILHQDRKDHTLMNFAQDIDRHPPEVQQALALFMCNLFENVSSSEWLLYISEWTYNNQQTSNIRATTKVAVHCLLAPCPTLQDIGTSIIYNLAIKEVKTVKLHHAKNLRRMLPKGSKSKVFDDVAVELAMAILQFFQNKPSEEHLYRTLKALARFVTVSLDVPQFIQMIGPHPSTFKGTSERIDQLITELSKLLR